MHVHVQCPDGEAKFWLEPTIALAHNYCLSGQQIRATQQLVIDDLDQSALSLPARVAQLGRLGINL
jgi:hypothetical protein